MLGALIGLAVGVDDSMFDVKREREERAAGRSERAAIEVAAATSGRSILTPGLTVMVGDGRLVLTGDVMFASSGPRRSWSSRSRRWAADRPPGTPLEAGGQGRPAPCPVRPAPPA